MKAKARVLDEVMRSLNNDPEALKALAAKDSVSLHDLHTVGLLPVLLGRRVKQNTSGIARNLPSDALVFFKDLNSLTAWDFTIMRRFDSFGEITAYAVECLQKIYRISDRFKTFEGVQVSPQKPLSGKEDAELSRIVAKFQTDPGFRAKLRTMLPPLQPS